MNKSILKSKTFWFNILMALLPIYPPAMDLMKESPQLFSTIWAGLNVVLRFISKKDVVLLP